MATTQSRSKRKASGGRYHPSRTKKKYELSKFAANTRISIEKRVQTKRVIGNNHKKALLTVHEINVSGKERTQKTEIVNVLENPANPNLVRRNVLTKGAIVETKLGKVKVTSRPGQEGAISGKLL
jgi:small subunit ribosomal protein S8e